MAVGVGRIGVGVAFGVGVEVAGRGVAARAVVVAACPVVGVTVDGGLAPGVGVKPADREVPLRGVGVVPGVVVGAGVRVRAGRSVVGCVDTGAGTSGAGLPSLMRFVRRIGI
jgi:hypothetical protein